MCVSDTINFPSHPYFSRDSAFLTTQNHPSDLQACPQAGGVVGELQVWGFLLPSRRNLLSGFPVRLPNSADRACVCHLVEPGEDAPGRWLGSVQPGVARFVKTLSDCDSPGTALSEQEQQGTRLVHNPLSAFIFKASPACWPMAFTRLPTLCTM